MNSIYSDIVQGSEEWHALRLGRVTASRISDVMAKTKSGPAASRKNYMAELLCERLTGEAAEFFESAAMKWGTEHEPFARAEYEAVRGEWVEEIGFAVHPVIEMAGASPDGLVGDTGLVEIKCPNTAQHLQTVLTDKVDRKYILQMQFQMICTGREWCDFVSYDPRVSGNIKTWIIRVDRDDSLVAEINREVSIFLDELDVMEKQVRAIK